MKEENEQPVIFLPHLVLFVITLVTTTFAGAEWTMGRSFFIGEELLGKNDFINGFSFSIPFLTVLTIHEFGHYFTARAYQVKVTLPYYIPFWLGFIGWPSLGTVGAFIRLKSPVSSRKGFFDIGIAGPLTGFVAALVLLWYGFTHLPPYDYIFQIHPDYARFGPDYAKYVYEDNPVNFGIGKNLLFLFFENFIATEPNRIPNSYELIHYPYLWAGYLALFFTALNLLPIGQLDGGHVIFGLFGYKRHALISKILFLLFVYYAGLGLLTPYQTDKFALFMGMILYTLFLFVTFKGLKFSRQNTLLLALLILSLQLVTVYAIPSAKGYNGWLLFTFLLGRVLGVYHPKAAQDEPLGKGRKILGWVALAIFILCFSPQPFIVD
ncbi:site-2 protease family protein [Xanthovirga aplysinae]|uniref:site-2 protease family protein n=1 Tax=Xanthovirga aplysinae TaxID=2529853 RepID=UPI0012BC3BAA|nr:site-2 protease family protein [Xanthovirga aplysinae]MTI33455.1 site-2 protease family protein [Xanthovirga aplysinae]